MNTNTPTHQDVIDYINKQYFVTNIDNYYEELDGKLFVYNWVEFKGIEFSSLPNDMVFDTTCNLEGSKITSIPEDIVLNGNLYLNYTKIKSLPVLNISNSLTIVGTKFLIPDCTYIGNILRSKNTIYETLNWVCINGYFFSTGILS